MNNRERFINTMTYKPADQRPLHLVGIWPDTLERWRHEGLPQEVSDVNLFLGLDPLKVINVSGTAGLYPAFEEKTVKESKYEKIFVDSCGRTVRELKNHTSVPECIDYPVKTPEDLKILLDEHFDVSNLNARYSSEWEKKISEAKQEKDALILIDGGGYYWTLRTIAGVENASYLLYDAPELVDELFERYLTVTLDGIRRVSAVLKIDVIGYGEDIACKNGPLISPEMFRRLILPRYQKALSAAREQGINLTWYDSDGDLRPLLADYLSVNINTFAPCEVAAGMDPVILRKQSGKEIKLIGGFDKRIVASGREAVKREFERLFPVIREGGFLPSIDHSVSSDISWDNYRFFTDELRKYSANI